MSFKETVERVITRLWPGPSQDELDASVRQERQGIEERRNMRINVNADITVTRPSSDDFEKAMNLKRGDDETPADTR